MQCIKHPTRPAANTCNHCGNWLCDECAVDLQGRLMCRTCLAEFANASPAGTPETAPRPPLMPYRNISGGLLFFFSFFFPPGANYMYMGLIKRGLAAMCGFFLLIYMTIVATSGLMTTLFALAIPVLVLTVIFDGFNIRRRINAGEVVQDGISDVLGTVLRNKPLTIAILAIIVLAFAGRIFGVVFNLIGVAIPVLAIVFGLYLIFRRKPPKSE